MRTAGLVSLSLDQKYMFPEFSDCKLNPVVCLSVKTSILSIFPFLFFFFILSQGAK